MPLFPAILIGTSYPEIRVLPNLQDQKTILLKEARNIKIGQRRQDNERNVRSSQIGHFGQRRLLRSCLHRPLGVGQRGLRVYCRLIDVRSRKKN